MSDHSDKWLEPVTLEAQLDSSRVDRDTALALLAYYAVFLLIVTTPALVAAAYRAGF